MFVSHNMGAVRNLCPRSMLLDKGSILMMNETDLVIDHYLDSRASLSNAVIDLPDQVNQSNEMGKGLRLLIKDELGNIRNEFEIGERWVIRLEFETQRNLKHVIAAVGLITHNSISLVTFWSQPADLEPGRYFVDFLCDLPLKATRISMGWGYRNMREHFIIFKKWDLLK